MLLSCLRQGLLAWPPSPAPVWLAGPLPCALPGIAQGPYPRQVGVVGGGSLADVCVLCECAGFLTSLCGSGLFAPPPSPPLSSARLDRRKEHVAVLVQSMWRAWRQRRCYLGTVEAITRLQAQVRWERVLQQLNWASHLKFTHPHTHPFHLHSPQPACCPSPVPSDPSPAYPLYRCACSSRAPGSCSCAGLRCCCSVVPGSAGRPGTHGGRSKRRSGRSKRGSSRRQPGPGRCRSRSMRPPPYSVFGVACGSGRGGSLCLSQAAG